MEDFSRETIFARHAAAAGLGVAIEAALTCPLDTVKTLLQVTAGVHSQMDMSSLVARVRSLSGLSGLYSGLGWMTLGKAPALGVRFGTYELLTAFYKDGREEKYVYVSEAFLAGLASGALESFVVTPFDLFKVRSQVTSITRHPFTEQSCRLPNTTSVVSKLLPGYSSDKRQWDRVSRLLSALPSKNSNVINALQEYPWLVTGSGQAPFVRDLKGPLSSISLEGWSVLWRGLRPGIFRDAAFSGFFFSCWQFLHDIVIDWKGCQMKPLPKSLEEIGPLSPLELSITAGLSGSIAGIVSHSFDTAKNRSQCIVTPKYITMERKFCKWKVPGTWVERFVGINPLDRKLLYHGLRFRAAQTGIACFALVGGYHLAVSHLLN